MVFAKDGTLIIDEMSIVDVITRLIFDSDSELDDTELLVVELLGQVDPTLTAGSQRDLSEYLRAMGVDEMIRVVGQIKQQLECQQDLIVAKRPPHGRPLHR